MEVHFKNETSDRKNLPGGGPQGTILGMFLFLILINAAGLKEKIKNTGQIITQPMRKRKPIDDMTFAESINLKATLIKNPEQNPPRPFNYHERTQHILPKQCYQMQTILDDLKTYTHEHQMRVNEHKTKVILFNSALKYDFQPNLALDADSPLEVVEEIRLLGVQVKSDLSWCSNTASMCKKAYARIWMLRRLKPLGASVDELMDVYDKQIRCMVEFASPVWTSGLTLAEMNQIERVQKCAFHIILADKYLNYTQALKKLGRKTLSLRRTDLNLTFAKKCLNSDKYSHWFCEYDPSVQLNKTRSEMPDLLLEPVRARTNNFKKSPIAYLTRLLNENHAK